jgi:hypothetical protein
LLAGLVLFLSMDLFDNQLLFCFCFCFFGSNYFINLFIPKGLSTKAVPKQGPSGVQGHENTIHEVRLFF